MTMIGSKDLLHSSDKQHLMLLYDDDVERSSAEIDCINRALEAGQYCVYATVDANERDFLAKLAPKIVDYDKQVDEGNLRVVNFKPYYVSAAMGELAPFRLLKSQVEAAMANRIASGRIGKALIVADAACNLARNKQFDECVTLEGWWQDTYSEWMAKKLDITIICAHPSSVLKQESLLNEQHRISKVHSLTLDLTDFIGKKNKPSNVAEQQVIRILIAEPDADIRMIYGRYLKSLPVNVVSVETAEECLAATIMPGNRESYDLIIIDTHMREMSGLRIAKKILEERPDQNIILTSTWGMDAVRSEMLAHSIDPDKYAILHKPFLFSNLLALIKPAKFKISS